MTIRRTRSIDIPIPLAPESSVGQGFVNELSHGHRGLRDKALDGAGGDTGDAVGFAAIVSEDKLIEIGLQVFGLDGAGIRAEQPALEQ